MHVLMTADTLGGVWTYSKELAVELLRRGCSVSLVCFGRPPAQEQKQWLEERAAASATFQFFTCGAPLEWNDNNDTAYSGGEALLLQILEQQRCDVLISNQYCWGALPCEVPKIVVAHSDIFTWQEACHEPPFEERGWVANYRVLVRNGLAGADACVAPSHAYLRDVSRFFPLPQNSRAIHCCREVPAGTDAPASRKLQAITAGRMWDKAKNLSILGTAELPLPVLVAGETQMDGQSFAGSAGTATLLGQQSPAALLNLFRESSVYLCTSQYEPFGLAPVEAALCGCAVACFDIPTLREVWGDAALFFRTGDELSHLLRSLVEAPELLASYRARAQQQAAQYTPRAMGDAWMTLLHDVTGGAAHA